MAAMAMSSMAGKKPIVHQEPSEATKAQFTSIPWASKLFQDPHLHPFSIRPPKHHTTTDTFCSKTLATDDTIIAWQTFYKEPKSSDQFPEFVSLLKLGSGVNGHIDTCHGGFVSVVLDEILGAAAEYESPVDKVIMTAYLNVEYKKPVHTPCIILARSWLEKREGRKMWGRGTIEDGNGTVLATCQALFLVVEPLKPRGNLTNL